LEEHGPEGTLIEGRVPARLAAALRPYAIDSVPESESANRQIGESANQQIGE
jgi:hypothetical protein